MGVLTLLKHLAPCLKDSHVERYRGKTVAVDGNTFIFRGCYSCSEQVRRNENCRNCCLPSLIVEIQILNFNFVVILLVRYGAELCSTALALSVACACVCVDIYTHTSIVSALGTSCYCSSSVYVALPYTARACNWSTMVLPVSER